MKTIQCSSLLKKLSRAGVVIVPVLCILALFALPSFAGKITSVVSIDTLSKEMVVHCRAGTLPVNISCTFPASGGVRLHADSVGFFVPTSTQSLTYTFNASVITITTPTSDLTVTFQQSPFRISVSQKNGNDIRVFNDSDLVFSPDSVEVYGNLTPNEAIYGFGERFNKVNFHGDSLTLWQMDAWPASGPLYGMRLAYKNIPFFHSTAGYSIFLNSTYKTFVDVGKFKTDRLHIIMKGPIFDVYIFGHDPLKAIQSYTALTGKPILPPKWAFEPWAGGGVDRWGNNPLTAVMTVVRRFKTEDIPHSAIYVEQMNQSGSFVTALYDSLKRYNLRPLTWNNSEISVSTARSLLSGVADNDLPVVRLSNGTVFLDTMFNKAYIDFTNPKALDLVRANLKSQLDKGLCGTMLDFGDLLPENCILYNGKSGRQMHNFYAFDYHRIFNQVFREKRGADFIFFSRGASPGCQQFAGQMAGDHASNRLGIISSVIGSLNLCATGFSTWGGDIGGYSGTPSPTEYARWVGYGCFSPLMRCHGQTPREPWYFAPDTQSIRIYKQYTWLRENLLDYIYSNAINAHVTGVPILRALPLVYHDQPELAVTTEYLFGPDFLVAPVPATDYGTTLNVLFPQGSWVHLWSKMRIDVPTVPTTMTMPFPLDQITVFLNQGAVVPLRINTALKLGVSMTSGSVKALLITPPSSTPSTRQYYQSVDTVWNFTSTSNSASSFTLQTDKLNTTPYVLVYGTEVTGVTVDGNVITQLTTKPQVGTIGWYKDLVDTGRTIVSLPSSGWSTIVFGVKATGLINRSYNLTNDLNKVKIKTDHNQLIISINQPGTYTCTLWSPNGKMIAISTYHSVGTYVFADHTLAHGLYLFKFVGPKGTHTQQILAQ